MHVPQPEEYEPVGRPVRPYENWLGFAAGLLWMAGLWTHYSTLALSAAASILLLIALSLWTRLVLPRFSVTRCAFIIVGLYRLVVLFLTTVVWPDAVRPMV